MFGRYNNMFSGGLLVAENEKRKPGELSGLLREKE
jgi:hypothetical protein